MDLRRSVTLAAAGAGITVNLAAVDHRVPHGIRTG